LAAEQKRWTGPVMTSTDTTIGAAAPGEIPGEKYGYELTYARVRLDLTWVRVDL